MDCLQFSGAYFFIADVHGNVRLLSFQFSQCFFNASLSAEPGA
jgi:hypothetical protein